MHDDDNDNDVAQEWRWCGPMRLLKQNVGSFVSAYWYGCTILRAWIVQQKELLLQIEYIERVVVVSACLALTVPPVHAVATQLRTDQTNCKDRRRVFAVRSLATCEYESCLIAQCVDMMLIKNAPPPYVLQDELVRRLAQGDDVK